jgi:hypothetical protein
VHLKVIACEIAAREVYHCAAQSVNTVSIELLTQGLHDNSDVMRRTLQEHLDGLDVATFDAVLLGYGLCNNGIVGLRAPGVELVAPRAHDCITFLLGSKERYAKEFDGRPGTYYFSSGWLEYPDRKGEKPELMHNSGLGGSYSRYRDYQKLVEQYGEDNATYLMEFMSQWQEHYTHGALIDFDFVEHLGLDRRVRDICMEKGWEFLRLQGRLDLLQDWLDGRWDEERFLRVPPGHVIEADYRGGIVRAVRPDDTAGDEADHG